MAVSDRVSFKRQGGLYFLSVDDAGHAVCLIDLSQMIWPFEMVDGLRSWCNPGKEDERPARLDLTDAALAGYGLATPGFDTRGERSLSLAWRRFASSSRRGFFGWNKLRYPSRGDHNLARGIAMGELHESVQAQRAEAERIVHKRLV